MSIVPYITHRVIMDMFAFVVLIRTRYTLYAFDQDGRVWLATHEWTAGNLVIQGDRFAVPDLVWGFLPVDVPLSLRLRRVPADATARPRDLACSPPLPITRRRP